VKTVVLDGATIYSIQDFHSKIAVPLNFPAFYGRNLDALWDCLSGCIDTNVKLVWKDHVLSKHKLGHDFSKIIGVFERVKQLAPEFQFELQ
jgi:ribonuclease inhibitor